MKLIDKIRKYIDYNDPDVASIDEWMLHDRKMEAKAPLRYKIKEFRVHISVLKRKIRDFFWWFRYRTTHRYHKIWTGLEPGYYDPRTVLLHASFQILVDFVEIEKASKNFEKYKELSKWEQFKSKFIKRNPAVGLDYLEWETTLEDSPHQAESAKRIITLYHWWTKYRLQRREVKYVRPEIEKKYVLYTLSEEFKTKYPEEHKEMNQIHRMNWHIEHVHDMIDDIMLKQLADVRLHLWA